MTILRQRDLKVVNPLCEKPHLLKHQKYNTNQLGYFTQILIMIIAMLAIVGWWLDIGFLKSGGSGFATIKVNTAICFFLLGFASWLKLTQFEPGPFSQTLSILATLIGLISLTEYIFHIDLSIDQLLFTDVKNIGTINPPGRMALITSVYFVVAGIGMYLSSLQSRLCIMISQVLAIIGISIGFISLLGYTYGREQLYDVSVFSTVSIQSAILFVLLGFCLLFSRPSEALIAIITTPYSGSLIAKKILPLAIISPFIIGWLRLYGEKSGFYQLEFGQAVVTTAYMLAFIIIVWISARHLNMLDKARLKAEQELRIAAVYFQSDNAIAITDANKLILRTNQSFTKITGYSEEEYLGHTYPILHAKEKNVKTFEDIWRVLKDKNNWCGEVETYRKNGQHFHQRLNITTVNDTNGQVCNYVIAFSDITTLKATEVKN